MSKKAKRIYPSNITLEGYEYRLHFGTMDQKIDAISKIAQKISTDLIAYKILLNTLLENISPTINGLVAKIMRNTVLYPEDELVMVLERSCRALKRNYDRTNTVDQKILREINRILGTLALRGVGIDNREKIKMVKEKIESFVLDLDSKITKRFDIIISGEKIEHL